MSADNGIYILETSSPDLPTEYRVRELMAVENVYWDDEKHEDSNDPNIWIENAREMWNGCTVYYSRADALGDSQDWLYSHGQSSWR